MSKCLSADGIEIQSGMEVLDTQFGTLEDWDGGCKVIGKEFVSGVWYVIYTDNGEVACSAAEELFASRAGLIQSLIERTEAEIERLEEAIENEREELKNLRAEACK